MILHKEVKTILENAIIQLPKKYRSVYIFREIKELSTKETAALLFGIYL
ncbi:sigma factor-like helix-turn-helix DNA-binding protein [Aquimarina sp. 2304DJ70-9]